MGYLHIPNLYKDPTILMFRECYALEKVDGTSSHLAWRSNPRAADHLRFFSGGAKHGAFVALFDAEDLARRLSEVFGESPAVIFGEAYGGKVRGMSKRYGQNLRFAAFDVKVGDCWLDVPNAQDVCGKVGVEFVPFRKVEATKEALDAERDRSSALAARLGMGERPQEGVVLRPLTELTRNNGDRVIAKHKRAEERETATPREVDAGRLQVLANADALAAEWVTPKRLEHVLGHLVLDREEALAWSERDTGDVILAMTEDVFREGAAELVESKDARRAIGSKTAALFKTWLKNAPLDVGPEDRGGRVSGQLHQPLL